MSLLLDALQRASRDKAQAGSPSPELTLHDPAPVGQAAPATATEAVPTLPPLDFAPALDELTLVPAPAPAPAPTLSDLPTLDPLELPPDPELESAPMVSPVSGLADRPGLVAAAQPSPAPPVAMSGAEPVPALSLEAPIPPLAAPVVAPDLAPAPPVAPAPPIAAAAMPVAPTATADAATTAAPTSSSARVAQQMVSAQTPVAKPKGRMRVWVWSMLAALLAAVALAVYWINSMGAGLNPAPQAQPMQPAAQPPASAAAPVLPAPVASSAAAPAADAVPVTATATPQAKARPRNTGRAPTNEPGGESASGTATAPPSAPKAVAAGRNVPSVNVRTTGANVLEAGYAALKAGRLEEAADNYIEALKAQPDQRDALLGLAYIAHKTGRRDDARTLYERVLRQDPDQPEALAGLASLEGASDAVTGSTRARDVVERHPESAPALAALGALLVKEGRLAEARLAFARAQALEPQQAVYAYNLAVALDRLHQYEAARGFYERALNLADAQSAEPGFSRSSAKQRLDQLKANLERQP